MPSYLKNALARCGPNDAFRPLPRGCRVLIVDDYKSAADALAAYLSLAAMDCQIALGGVPAIEIGTAWRPDVIIMDISMPDLNGFEATLALRQDLRTGNHHFGFHRIG